MFQSPVCGRLMYTVIYMSDRLLTQQITHRFQLAPPYLSATDATAVLMNVAVLAEASADTLPRPSEP